jgi:hypothetical protein
LPFAAYDCSSSESLLGNAKFANHNDAARPCRAVTSRYSKCKQTATYANAATAFGDGGQRWQNGRLTIGDDVNGRERRLAGIVAVRYNAGAVLRGRPLDAQSDRGALARKTANLDMETVSFGDDRFELK